MIEKDCDYLLNKTVKIYQPEGFYHASTDAVWLAAAVDKVKKGDAVLDVGSGTGAVALCLAARFKNKGLLIEGVEWQKELVAAAGASAIANGFENVSFTEVDVLKKRYKPCSFNHVISNPPYSIGDMPSPNQSKAKAHNFDKEAFDKWIDFCLKALRSQGKFYMINRAEMLEYILADIHGRLGGIEVFPIFSKPADVKAKRVIVRAQKSSKAALTIHTPLYVYGYDGKHSDLAERVLRAGEAF